MKIHWIRPPAAKNPIARIFAAFTEQAFSDEWKLICRFWRIL